MKLYVFINKYVTGVHAGIQAAHAVAELMLNARFIQNVKHWAKVDKTIVLLNGGDQSAMELIWDEILDIHVARASFFKEPGLNDALTAIAFLPDPVEQELIDNHRKGMYSDPEIPVLTPNNSPVLYRIATSRTIS